MDRRQEIERMVAQLRGVTTATMPGRDVVVAAANLLAELAKETPTVTFTNLSLGPVGDRITIEQPHVERPDYDRTRYTSVEAVTRSMAALCVCSAEGEGEGNVGACPYCAARECVNGLNAERRNLRRRVEELERGR